MQISHWYRVSFLLPCSAARMRRITLSRFRWSSFVTGLENCGVILRLNWGRLRSRTDAEKGDNVIRMYVHCIHLLLFTIWALSTVTASITYGADATGEKKFGNIAAFALALFSLPFSNATGGSTVFVDERSLTAIGTSFGLRVRLVDVIKCAKFYRNRLRGFDSVRGRNLTIPIGLRYRR